MKPFTLCLLAALVLQGGVTAVRACQYCRMAAEDPESAKMAAAMHAGDGSFPLNSSINQFQGVAPAATLTAPPPVASVTTSAADLPKTVLPAATTHRLPPPAAAKTASAAPAAPAAASAATAANRWANGGLLGLAGLAGVFGWRTRRTKRSGS